MSRREIKLAEIQSALMAGKQQTIDPVAINEAPGVTNNVFTFFQSSEN